MSDSNKVMMMIASGSIRPGPISFNIYTRNSENQLVLFCRKGLSINEEHMQILSRTNRVFYISSDQMENYLDYSFERLESFISSPDVKAKEKTRFLNDLGKKVVNNLMTNPRSGEAIHHCKRLVKNTVELLINAPESSMLLLEMANDNSYLLSHSISTSIFSLLIGRQMFGENRDLLYTLGQGGILVDIGMTRISRKILFKKNDLHLEEWREIKSHPLLGKELILKHHLSDDVRDMVLMHHERLDGSGYPLGLSGDEIPMHARIVAIADAYDALTSDRTYRRANVHLKALRIIEKEIEKYDPDVYEALLRVVLQRDELIEKFTLSRK